MSEALAPMERGTLQAFEAVIEKGLASFVEVGRALTQIRDSRLYREDFKTFEDYCESRWGMTKQRAYQVIEASGVAERVKNSLPEAAPIVRASHAEALAELPDDEQAEAWQEAVETADGDRVTADDVEEVVDRRMGRAKPAAEVNRGPAPIYAEISRDFERLEMKIDGACQPHPLIERCRGFLTRSFNEYAAWLKDAQP